MVPILPPRIIAGKKNQKIASQARQKRRFTILRRRKKLGRKDGSITGKQLFVD
jgi:hypothetical protein